MSNYGVTGFVLDRPITSDDSRRLRRVGQAIVDTARLPSKQQQPNYTRPGEMTDSREAAAPLRRSQKTLTVADLGWTRERALEIRGQLASFAQDWDDPSMDAYDEL